MGRNHNIDRVDSMLAGKHEISRIKSSCRNLSHDHSKKLEAHDHECLCSAVLFAQVITFWRFRKINEVRQRGVALKTINEEYSYLKKLRSALDREQLRRQTMPMPILSAKNPLVRARMEQLREDKREKVRCTQLYVMLCYMWCYAMAVQW